MIGSRCDVKTKGNDAATKPPVFSVHVVRQINLKYRKTIENWSFDGMGEKESQWLICPRSFQNSIKKDKNSIYRMTPKDLGGHCQQFPRASLKDTSKHIVTLSGKSYIHVFF